MKRIVIYTSDVEYKAWKDTAKAERVSLSDWLRTLANRAAVAELPQVLEKNTEPGPREEQDVPVCPGCTEAYGTESRAVVRHMPPLCRTSAEIMAGPLVKRLIGKVV